MKNLILLLTVSAVTLSAQPAIISGQAATDDVVVFNEAAFVEADGVPALVLGNTDNGYATMTFNVDMTDVIDLGIFNPTTDQVAVVGSFENWISIPMDMVSGVDQNLWQLALDIEYGVYEFKFIILYPSGETLWEPGENRVLGVTDRDWELELLSFRTEGLGFIDAQVTLNVDMEEVANLGVFEPPMDQVIVSGDFNDGQPLLMGFDQNGDVFNYETTFALGGGDYSYRYAILRPDGNVEWELDMARGLSIPEPEIGGYVTIALYDEFAYDASAGGNDSLAVWSVDFSIDMTPTAANGLFSPGIDEIAVAGGFNNWSPEPLVATADSSGLIYAGTSEIEPGLYEYKFVLIRPSGATIWELGVNRSLFVGQNDVILPLATFNSGQSTTFSGWVLDQATGLGIDGAAVALMPLDPEFPDPVTGSTDSSGYFLFTDLAPTPQMMMVEAEGYLPFSAVVDYPQQNTFTAVLEPLPEGAPALISGSVLQDSSLLPVPGAVVAAVSMAEEGVYTVNPDAQGNYELAVPPDTYIILALGIVGDILDPSSFGIHYEFWNDAYTLEDAGSLFLTAGESIAGVNFSFPQSPENGIMSGNMVMGNVSHSGGASVDGSLVTILDAEGSIVDSAPVDVNGSFSFSGLALEESYTLQASHSEYGEVAVDMVSESMIAVQSLEFSALSLDESSLPSVHALEAYPNPFNPQTTIRYSLAERGAVELSIFNLRGQRIATLVNRVQAAGHYDARWNGLDGNLSPVATGVYLAVLQTAGQQEHLKLLYLK